jgi:iron complex transport system substrate-binding protein
MTKCWPLLLLLGSCSGQPTIAPNRILSNNPCIDSVLAEIAAPGQIAAVSIYSHDANSASAPLAWAQALPALGTSAEEIIAARPALLLTGNYAMGGTNAALAKAGVKTLALGVPATIAENAAQIRQIARAIGRVDAGEILVHKIEAATEPLSTLHKTAIIWQNGGFVAGKGTLQDAMLERAGFTNASIAYGLKQWDILPMETLIRKPPSVIFMPTNAKGMDKNALVMRNKLLRHVQGKTRVIAFPDRLLFCGGPTIIKAMTVFHPAHQPAKAS